MSQGVQFSGVVEGISTRSDGSLGIRLGSAEFSADEKLMVFNLQNIACNVVLAPVDSEQVPKEIKSQLQKKTSSQRLRACYYVWWRQLGEPGLYEVFYEAQMEKLINGVKEKLQPV